MFVNCTSLRMITIPVNVTELYRQLFRNCSKDLIRFISLPTTPPTLDSDNLWVTPLSICVPVASVDAYKEAWFNYSAFIQPIS